MSSDEWEWLKDYLHKDLYKKVVKEGFDPKAVYEKMTEFLREKYPQKLTKITKILKKREEEHEPDRTSVREYSIQRLWTEKMKERAEILINSCPVSPSEKYQM